MAKSGPFRINPDWQRQASWLLPGLSLKRWLGLSVIGAFFILMGSALWLNLHPITYAIEFLRWVAPYVPTSVSGPVIFLVGVLYLYFGSRKAYRTVKTAMAQEGQVAGLLEALYRQNKLVHGPQIVAIGGGTGLSTLLRGIKNYTNNVTAVVTVGDDGGSSGRLREEQGIIPPGDIRNCIAALANEEQLITELFQYRFKTGEGLSGHSFGNLFLTAMCQITGDMFTAIKESSKVLNIRGQVLPSTLDNVKLVAEMEDGSIVHGESNIPEAGKRIRKLSCDPVCPTALPEVIQAIRQAELILIGPGSLYTSILPNLLINEISLALSQSKAPKVYIANIMSQPGETHGYTVADHVQAILDHAPYENVLDCVFVNSWLPKTLVNRYSESNCYPIELDSDRCEALGVKVVQRLLVDERSAKSIRHDPKRIARSIIHWFKHEYQRAAKVDPVVTKSLVQSLKAESNN
jgi:uncharacterized cofD-like protein